MNPYELLDSRMDIKIDEDEKMLLCYEHLSTASSCTTEASDIPIENYDEAPLYCHENLSIHEQHFPTNDATDNQTITVVRENTPVKKISFSDIISPVWNSNKNELDSMQLLTAALSIVEKGAFAEKLDWGSDEEQEVAEFHDSSSLSDQSTSLVPNPAISASLHDTNTSEKLRFFPEKLFNMITDRSKTDPTVINWVLDGDAFIISDKSPRLKPILREYFYHDNYSSLQRQLNMYGFKKATNGKYEGTFHHPSFHRDISCRSQLSTIERKCRPQRKAPHSRWEKMFELLCQHQKTHGNCYITRTNKSNQHIYKWVNKQRNLYKDEKKGGYTAMSQDRVDRLNSIGFDWNTK